MHIITKVTLSADLRDSKKNNKVGKKQEGGQNSSQFQIHCTLKKNRTPNR